MVSQQMPKLRYPPERRAPKGWWLMTLRRTALDK